MVDTKISAESAATSPLGLFLAGVQSGGNVKFDPTLLALIMMQPVNLGLACSVGSSALTIAIKGVDGNDPSSTNPVYIPFRSATPATGTPVVRAITAATSLVITSGSTLGAPTGSVPFKVWVVAFDDAGTVRLGAILCTTLASGVLTQFPLASWGIASSTAEGGAGGADLAQTFFTGTAVTSKAYTVLGVLSFESGLSTAGTWAAVPTRTQLFDQSVDLPGRPIQTCAYRDGATATGTTTIPLDNTIPQNTEGTQFMSQSITPSSAANILRVQHLGLYAPNVAENMICSLFRDSTAAALSTMSIYQVTGTATMPFSLNHHALAGSTSATAFKVRCGTNGAATTRFNGGSAQFFGGSAGSFLEVQEIAA